MVNGLLAAEIDPVVWGTPANFNGFRLGSVNARHSSSGHQPNFAALNRGHHLYSAGRPSRWAHILVFTVSQAAVQLLQYGAFVMTFAMLPGLIVPLLSPYYGIRQAIALLHCGYYLLSSISFSRLISAVADWMSTTLPHMMWP